MFILDLFWFRPDTVKQGNRVVVEVVHVQGLNIALKLPRRKQGGRERQTSLILSMVES